MKFHDFTSKFLICCLFLYWFVNCYYCRKFQRKYHVNLAKKLKKEHDGNHSHKALPNFSKDGEKYQNTSTLVTNNENSLNISESEDGDNENIPNQQANAVKNMVEQFKQWKYHNYVEMTWFLNFYNKSCSNMAHLYSIGASVQNRELWVMALGKYPDKHTPGIPEVKLVGNIHGNEVAGKEILMYTIRYICENIKRDPEFSSLLSRIRLHILPSLNPDGYEMSFKKGFGDKLIGRLNSNGVDINRNFPDQFFPSYHDLEPETVAVMEWLKKIPFVLSASYHDGAIAVSYPYDDSPSGQTKYSATPDDDIFRRISIVYAENHPTIHQGANQECSNLQSKRFVGGVTNGAEWSSLTNTMQDYNYIFSNCFEITVHLSCNKNISANQINSMFDENLKPMKEFIKQSLKGIKGFVKNSEGEPLEGVKISINDRKHDVSTSKDGDFWRLLLPGTYQLSAHHKGYITYEKLITVDFDEPDFTNITLSKKQADMALLKLGHVGLMKKISNIMMYEADGRDFEETIGFTPGTDDKVNNKNEKEPQHENLITVPANNNNNDYNQLFGNQTRNILPFGVKNEVSNNLNPLEQYNNKNKIEAIYHQTNKNNNVSNNGNSQDKMIIGVQLVCKVSGKPLGIEGKMKWMGTIKGLSKDQKKEPPLIVGIELYNDDELATDGEFMGVRYFKTKPKRAYFVPVKLCDIKT